MFSLTIAALEKFDNQHDFERMCADILNSQSYKHVVLIAPRGGSDGGKDITFTTDSGRRCLACVTLRKDMDTKFKEDFSKRKAGDFDTYILFCTDYLTAEQKIKYAKYCAHVLQAEFVPYDIEALRSLLDSSLLQIREKYLHTISGKVEELVKSPSIDKVKIFFCYAREDERLMNKLKKHLKPLQHEGLIDVWHDRDISAGLDWEHEIKQHLDEAQIILLLVSPDFMASDYCYSKEMKQALERHKRGEAYVIPIILRHVDWQRAPFGKLQSLPTDGKPVKSWQDQDKAFLTVEEGILKAVEQLNTKPFVRLSITSTSSLYIEEVFSASIAPPPAEPKSLQYQSITEKRLHDINSTTREEALAQVREEMQKLSEADRLLIEADKYAPNLMEKEKLVKAAVEIWPPYKPDRYRKLGIEMSIAVLDGFDLPKQMSLGLVRYRNRLRKDEIVQLTNSGISYLRETVLNATTPDTDGLLYLACLYGYQQQFDEMVGIVEKTINIDDRMKGKFRQQKILLTLLRACGSDRTKLEKLRKNIGVSPVTKKSFSKHIKDFDLEGFHGYIEWIAMKKLDAVGETGSFIIKITPPYAVNKGLVDATALRVEDGKTETIVPVDKNVTIEELFDKLNSLFFLISPSE